LIFMLEPDGVYRPGESPNAEPRPLETT